MSKQEINTFYKRKCSTGMRESAVIVINKSEKDRRWKQKCTFCYLCDTAATYLQDTRVTMLWNGCIDVF